MSNNALRSGISSETYQSDISNKPPRCPLCGNRLYPKKCGYVCKNANAMCLLYWKMSGWCLKNPGSSLWVYTDNSLDKQIRWDKKHGYPPLHTKISKRHIDAMHAALRKDESLCFVIPLRYYSENSEVVPE